MLNESVIKVLKNGMRDIAKYMQMVGDFLYIEGMIEDKNNVPFYEKHGFKLMQESMYPSALAQAELRCMEMSINLLG